MSNLTNHPHYDTIPGGERGKIPPNEDWVLFCELLLDLQLCHTYSWFLSPQGIRGVNLIMSIKIIPTELYSCENCDHEWSSRIADKSRKETRYPIRCPRCRSKAWNHEFDREQYRIAWKKRRAETDTDLPE